MTNNNFLKGFDYYYDKSYYGGNLPVILNSGQFKQTDNRKTPLGLVKYWTTSKIALGVYDKIKTEVNANDFCFVPKSESASQVVAEKLDNILTEAIDLQNIIDKIVAGFWGACGDILIYEKNGEFKAYNFFEEGKERVGFYTDSETNQIYRYDILSLYSGQTIDSVEAKNAVHLKFANPFSSVLGVTPAIVLYDYWRLKEQISIANETIYSNGLQASKLLSVKPFNDMGQEAILKHLEMHLIKLKEEVNQGSGLLNRNKTWISGVPGLQVDNLQMNNAEMKSMEIIDKIDEQTYLAFGVPMELFNPRYNKYNDVEILRDMIRKYIDKKMKCYTQNVITDFILPRLFSNFKFNKYEYKYKKTITAEDLELQKQKTEKTKVFFNFLTEAKKSGLDISLTDEKTKELENYGIIIKTNSPVLEANKEPVIDNVKTSQSVEQEIEKENKEEEKENLENQRAVDQERLNEVFSKYKATVNMSASELESWSNNECSKLASLDRSPIERNLRLLKKKKSEWTEKDITDANRTISFVSRMKANLGGEKIEKTKDGKECGTKAFISLKNWAFDANKTRQNLEKAKSIVKKALEKQLMDINV